MTYAAVKNFQYTNNIQTTGTVGPLTRSAIASLCGSGSSSSYGSYSNSNTTYTTNGTPSTGQPTLTMNFSSNSITPGNYSIISWNASNVTSCVFENMHTGIKETIPASGSRYVYPTETRIYQIDCTNGYNTASKNGTVYVQSTTSTTNPVSGASISITNVTANLLSGQYVNIPSNSQIVFVNKVTNTQLSTPTLYTSSNYGTASFTIPIDVNFPTGVYALRAINNWQTVGESTMFIVSIPAIDLTASSYSIQAGSSTYLTWKTNGTGCRLDYNGTSQNLIAAGSIVITPTTTTTYKLICTSGITVNEKSITVTVTSPYTNTTTTNTTSSGFAPVIGFSASSYSITSGQSAQIAWNTSGADICTLYYGSNVEKNFAQGMITVYPTQTTTYRIMCANSSYSAEKSLTINVTPASTSSSRRNIVDGNGQASCNATIATIYGSQVATCSVGGGCDGLNPGLWGACVTGTPVNSSNVYVPTQAQLSVSPATVSTTQNFTVSWSGNNSPTTYNVKVDNTVLPQTGTTWTGTPASLGLSAGSHTIQAQACNISGCSPYTAVYTLTVTEIVTRNFVHGEGQTACNALIVSTYGSQVATCSVGGGCSGLNPGLWGACVTR